MTTPSMLASGAGWVSTRASTMGSGSGVGLGTGVGAGVGAGVAATDAGTAAASRVPEAVLTAESPPVQAVSMAAAMAIRDRWTNSFFMDGSPFFIEMCGGLPPSVNRIGALLRESSRGGKKYFFPGSHELLFFPALSYG